MLLLPAVKPRPAAFFRRFCTRNCKPKLAGRTLPFAPFRPHLVERYPAGCDLWCAVTDLLELDMQ